MDRIDLKNIFTCLFIVKIMIVKIVFVFLFSNDSIAFEYRTSSVSFSEDNKVVYVKWLDYDKKPIYFQQEKYSYPKEEFSLEHYPQSGLYLLKDRILYGK